MGERFRLISLFIILSIHIIFLHTDAMFEEITLLENTNGACAIAAADFNNDGHKDMVYTCFPLGHIQWLENNGEQEFTSHMVIEGFTEAKAIDVADINEDGYTDFAATANAGDRISWFENDHNGDFIEHVVTNEWDRPGFVLITNYTTNEPLDINSDGEVDILATACRQGRLGWFENDGEENFTEHIIMDGWTRVSGVAPCDLDADGDVDILAAAQAGGICWFENIDNEFTMHTIYTEWDQANWIVAGYINEDEFLDFAATSCGASAAVGWFENNGSQQFEPHLLKENYAGARCPLLSDIDADGDLDIFSIGWQESEGNFFENRGDEVFREQIISTDAYDMLKYFAVDLDSDNDMDLIASTAVAGNHHIRLFDNLDSFLDVDFTVDNTSGHAPLSVNFTTSVYSKPPVNFWGWDFNNDGFIDSDLPDPEYIYGEPGNYSACLLVSNGPEALEIEKEDIISVFDGESALLFDNIYNYAVIPASAPLTLGSSFTLEAFTVPYDYGMNPNFGFGRIFDKGCIEVFFCNFFPLYNDESVVVKMVHQDGSISCLSTPANSLLLPGGRHIAVSYGGENDLKIFINGDEQELTIYDPLSGEIADNSTEDLYIGNSAEVSNSFLGVIDEVRIWDRALSTTEINAGLNDYLSGEEADLKAYWRLNEGCGDVFYDLTSNLNNGELTQCSWIQGDPFDLTGSESTQIPVFGEIEMTAYPNPFNPVTNISFIINTELTENTELVIYNLKGQKVKSYSFPNGSLGTSEMSTNSPSDQPTNRYSVTWNGTDENNQRVSSGIYLYKLSVSGKYVASKKGILLK